MDNRTAIIAASIIGASVIIATAIYSNAGNGKLIFSAPDERTRTRASASEEFELRSKCAQLGEGIMNDNVVGSALSQNQVSFYNPEINRCFVKLEVSTADITTPVDAWVTQSYLYDGQTKEMLGFAKLEKGRKSGMFFGAKQQFGYDEAIARIETIMADPHRQ